ncbi:MAG: acyl CoA:acetate/3-ketoacid CoA transferase [Candidatus Thermoplasmatota archaeon]|nr:acyl CoA:acetate/3-ketoacid CoA transferase [Candidatus Thermoplasmatota archaeon]
MVRVYLENQDLNFFNEIKDNSTLAISGFNLANTPEYLIRKLYEHYLLTGHPNNLFMESDALPASVDRGLDIILKDMYERHDYSLFRGLLVPFMGFSPYMQKIAFDDKIPVYGWPIGVASYWFREVASGRPGLLTRIGIGTFLDPDQDSGTLNESAKTRKICGIKKLNISGDQLLLYEAPKPDACFIRVSSSDSMGSLSMEEEPIKGTVINIAQAVKARPNPGKVIAQVKSINNEKQFAPRLVEVPYPLVDIVVKSPREFHWQAPSFEYDPRASFKISPSNITDSILHDFQKFDVSYPQSIIAKRVTLELVAMRKEKDSTILLNLGVGIPAVVSSILSRAGYSKDIVTIVESGPWGGVALTGKDFGISMGAFALSTIPDMFSNYEGGIIDVASLGFFQVDSHGNVNPSYIPGKLTGPGGFSVIAQGSPTSLFAGNFTAGKMELEFKGGKLKILKDGSTLKFVRNVYKIFFNGSEALKFGKKVRFITERCVFDLTDKGLLISEVAEGIDLEKDIMDKMEFKPAVSKNMKKMPEIVFKAGPMERNEIQQWANTPYK